MRNLRKVLLTGTIFVVVSASAIAGGVSWIDYDTGYYQCTNGFRGYVETCHNKKSTFNPLACNVLVKNVICNY